MSSLPSAIFFHSSLAGHQNYSKAIFDLSGLEYARHLEDYVAVARLLPPDF